MTGSLAGIKVVELAAIGPVPFAGMMLSDMGAQVTRVDRIPAPGGGPGLYATFDHRGRESIALDLKKPAGVEATLRLIDQADVLLEGFRPGVTEKLGLGPEVCLVRNPKLVYGRMTGWGQTGPLAHAAGHDLNYIALTGALHAMGSADRPPSPPLNLVGDYGGGAMMLLAGVLAALVERQRSGKGQVIDAAMTDGAAMLASIFYALRAQGLWSDRRSSNQLDGGAYYYGVYECADSHFVSIGSLEPQFYQLLLQKCGLSDDSAFQTQLDSSQWPQLRKRLEVLFKQRTRAEWCALMEGTDVCFAPVLSLSEAPQHPHNQSRGTFIEVDGKMQVAPAPRFSRTPSQASRVVPREGADTLHVLASAGFSEAEIRQLVDSRIVHVETET